MSTLVIVLIALFAIVLLVPTVLIFIAVITPVSAFQLLKYFPEWF
jgi:hypothetical protein